MRIPAGGVQVSSVVIGDTPETRRVLGLREPPETLFRQLFEFSGGFFAQELRFSQIYLCRWGVDLCLCHG